MLFYPDAPSQPVVTDVSWFMAVTQGIESLNKVEEVWNKQRVEGLGPDEAVFAQSQFIQHWKGDATDAQVRSEVLSHYLWLLSSSLVDDFMEATIERILRFCDIIWALRDGVALRWRPFTTPHKQAA